MYTACAVKSGLQELSPVIYLSENKGKWDRELKKMEGWEEERTHCIMHIK
jgi:hypothetical protein